MKIMTKLVLIIILSQFVFGCEKKETADNSSPEPATITAKTEEATGSPATTPVAETPAAEPQQPASEPEDPVASAPQKSELIAAPPLKGLEWVKGGPVTFEPGKVYIVEFWATWCGPCKVSIPHLTEIQKNYKDRGVTVIGISTERPETVKPYVESMGDKMDYTIAVDVEGFAQKDYMEAFNKQGIPQAFLINQASKIAWEGHPLDGMDGILELVVQGTFDPVAYAKQKAEAEAVQQQAMAWYMDYFRQIETGGLTEETKQLGLNFIEKAPVEGLNAFAWNILTRVKEADRDLQAALKAAEKATQLSSGKDPSVLDTYAMALFETGKIKEAIEAQQKAVDMAKDYLQAQEQLQQTLEKYKAALGESI
ncbi:MAG: redoxin domain-containing protein [Phycisphaerae bacterium]|nr:redoxin domain-containing protein [Phycisphaerae bacterium]